MVLLRIVATGIKLSSLGSFVGLQDAFGSQLALINAGNSIILDEKALFEKGGVETAIDLVNQFNENRNNSGQRGSLKGQEKRSSVRSDAEALSPTKSSAMKQSLLRDRKGLIVCPKSVLVLQGRECWKVE